MPFHLMKKIESCCGRLA